MLEYQESIVIRRPVEEVFHYMQDISREHEWQPNLREAEQTPADEAGVGTRRRYVSEFMGRRFENVYINTEYEINRKVAYESAAESDTKARGEITWEALGEGTKVTMRFAAEVGGMLRLVPKSLIAQVGKKELGEALARVKALLESES
ncbi:MAG: SRPBCC family protein [Gemmatimonadota bacterium]|nr:MAG: SRPBCC family protein [Gemmatimonadota bacterium]